MTLQEKLEELHRVKLMMESQDFQKYFCQPLRKKQDELRLNFFSDSLKDAWKKGGKYQGLNEFFEILKEINVEIKNTRDELESQG